MKSPRRSVKSFVVKRSMVVDGQKTSISLEDQFYEALKEIAKEREMTVKELVTNIKAERGRNINLSSAIRLFVLQHYEDQISVLKPKRHRGHP